MVVLGSVTPPVSGIRHQEAAEAHVQSNYLGQGTLFITESCVSWIGANGQGFQIQYPAISLHAVSRDTTSFPHQCLYLMIDPALTDILGDAGSDGSSDDGESKVAEMRFIPQDTGKLDMMFAAMSDCQALHPDDEDSFSEEEEGAGDDGYFHNEEDAVHLTEQGAATLARLEAMLGAGGDTQEDIPLNLVPQIGGLALNGGTEENNSQATKDTQDQMDTGQFEDADD